MTYLLDTHTLIWALTEPKKLSKTVRAIIENTDNEILVSAVSFWEISLKSSIHRLTLNGLLSEDFLKASIETGFRLLDLNGTTAASYHQLSTMYHRDPFDRMLIWQALQNKVKFISKDENVRKYASEGLTVVW